MIKSSKMFELGDVVLITDTYYNIQFTAHCIQKRESLIHDNIHQFEFIFKVDQNPENNINFITGLDRSDNVYQFTKLIGNIFDGEDQVRHK